MRNHWFVWVQCYFSHLVGQIQFWCGVECCQPKGAMILAKCLDMLWLTELMLLLMGLSGTVCIIMACQWLWPYPVFADITNLLWPSFVATGRISPKSLIGVSVTKQMSDFGVVTHCVQHYCASMFVCGQGGNVPVFFGWYQGLPFVSGEVGGGAFASAADNYTL